jgi:hypothetical protein
MNILGERAATVQGQVVQTGEQMAKLDISNLTSGIYLMKLEITQGGQSVQVFGWKKVAIIK